MEEQVLIARLCLAFHLTSCFCGRRGEERYPLQANGLPSGCAGESGVDPEDTRSRGNIVRRLRRRILTQALV